MKIKHKFTNKELSAWTRHQAKCISNHHCVVCDVPDTIAMTLLCRKHLDEFSLHLADPDGDSVLDMWLKAQKNI